MSIQAINSFIAITLISALTMTAQAGTAEQQQANVTAAEADTAKVVIYRPKQTASVKSINYRLYVNGEKLGRLKTSSYQSVDLPAGEHTITVNDKARSEYVFKIEAGETVVVKGLVSRTLNVNFTEMAPSAAIAEAPFVAKAIQATDVKAHNQLGSL